MFNLGAGEIAVMAVLTFLFLGTSRLPPFPRVASRWSRSEWLLVSAAVLTGAGALALLSAPR